MSTTAPSGFFSPHLVPGQYTAELTIDDGCQEKVATTTFEVKCAPNVITPYIQLVQGEAVLYFENHTTVIATGVESTFEYAWIDGIPSGHWTVTDPSGAVTITQAWSMGAPTVAFIPNMVGEWVLTLTLTDRCQDVTETMSIFVYCASEITPVARATPASSVTWLGTEFPIVTLDGKLSGWVHSSPSYEWFVVEAPKGSLFEGRDNVVYTEWVGDIHTVINDDSTRHGSNWEEHTINQTEYYTKAILAEFQETRLKQLGPEAAESYGACFRPDLPGQYTLELHMTTECASKVAQIAVTALCNGAPVITAVMPTNGTVWDRLTLDASSTVDPENDDLQYVWRVYDCEAETNASDVANGMSAVAHFVPSEAGRYCVELTVSDGCTEVVGEWEVDVACLGMPEVKSQEIEVTLSGLGLQKINMEIPIPKDTDAKWYDRHSYTWTLANYVEPKKKPTISGGGIAGIVIGVVAFVALVGAAAILGVCLYKRKH
jgi:hypothetical protein